MHVVQAKVKYKTLHNLPDSDLAAKHSLSGLWELMTVHKLLHKLYCPRVGVFLFS